jgi:hypothetical protein
MFIFADVPSGGPPTVYERMFVEDAPVAELPLELIERRIEEAAAAINAGSARWLELVSEFDRRTGWANTGCRSTAEWIAWRCGLTSRAAREHVRVARALPDLPLIRAAFASGELSYSKVRALTRVAAAESEAELLELARHATAAQLERIVRAARRVTEYEAEDARQSCFVRYHWDEDDGCLRVEAKLPPEDGALVLRALEATRDALYERYLADAEEDGSAEPLAATGPSGSAEPAAEVLPRVPSPTNAESLAALAEAALARPPTGLPGGERYQVLVHVDASTLATDEPGASATGPGACAIADGPALAPETARRLACDASLVTLLQRDGEPLSVGRRTRAIPPSIRRALLARDGRCQFPGCERHRFVDAHHIRHWAQGGETTLENLVLLCRHHNRLCHDGGYSVTRSPSGRIEWRRPDGQPLSPAPSRRAQPPPPAERPLLTGSGERMHLGNCVEAVLVATGNDGRYVSRSPG